MAFDFDRDTNNDTETDTQSTDAYADFGKHDFAAQCLRILRCTARALAAGPGGLKYQPGARPWLDGLPDAGAMLRGTQRRLCQANYSNACE